MNRYILIALIYLLVAICSTTVSATGITQSDEASSGAKLSTISNVFVNQFTFTGNKAVPAEELATVSGKYTGRKLSIEQIEELRQELIYLYVKKGFINSGVILPDQQVENGIINFRVIEGRLAGIQISGLKHFRESYISNRLRNGSSEPLNLNSLQEALQLLQQDQRIRRINADLQPGNTLGEAELNVEIEESSPYRMSLRFNNDAAPSTGELRGDLSLAHLNLLGFGDTLAADIGITEGALDFGTSYSIPVSTYDSTLSLYYRRNESTVTEELYQDMDIKSRSETYGLKLRHPVNRTANKEIALSVAGEFRESHSWLLGRPFSFSPGEHDGVARVSVLRIGQEFLHRDSSSILAINSTINIGIATLGSTTNVNEPDSRFFSWLGQFLFLSRVGQTPVQLMLRTNAQMAAESLLSIERFGLGGMNSVRGYRNNALVRDNGVNSSIELRIPLLQDENGWGTIQAIPFVDYGWGWNADYETPQPDTIVGVGGGVGWSIRNRILLEVYYGYGVNKVHVNSRELSDQGVHFQLKAEVF
ncbi:heme/hemopexin transporter protein HuxB [Geobacter sp. OR-1]|uniref:ShlB/FhaC/HecB family hemolysin secretion/activation protein n=1 Tax=Geobacter sp. OR-1 TaxID=1266765 RepID=UPI0005432061|nr:ShlB/FhaC/HecB family hemolysin secretion/activation protein [Geobacter sp. OR-1]GAM09458.1 heme/hemopexin transporter protein HuxB [Geobacter sp. OR-1]